MAGLRLLKGKYYARVHMPQGVRPRERKIPLKTDQEREAVIRLAEVDRVETYLKQGEDWDFPWMNDTTVTKPSVYTLDEAANDFLVSRRADGLRPKTLESYGLCLRKCAAVLGPSSNVSSIDLEDIDRLKRRWQGVHTPTTINIALRSLKAFLNWLNERGKITSVPRIKQVNGESRDPQYISNDQFNSICQQVTPYLARVFDFYRQTGLRLSEPFDATLTGNYLTISAEHAKGKRQRDILLSPDLILIYHELLDHTHIPEFYSKQFMQAARAAAVTGRKFHSLRHTAALRLYLQTKDIYQVSRQLGHADLSTTLIYTRYDLKRLQADFPDLVSEEHPESIPFQMAVGQ